MTKRMKKYSGRTITTAGVLVVLCLLIWALVSFAGYATVVNVYNDAACTIINTSGYARGTDIVFTRMTGCMPGKTYRAEYWGPSSNGGSDMTRRSRALNNVTSTGVAPFAVKASYTTLLGDNAGTWQARFLHNPNYTAAGRIEILTPKGAFAAGTVAANTIQFRVLDRDGNPVLFDCRQAASAGGANLSATLAYAADATPTTWTNVFSNVPVTTTGWSFNTSTGVYSYTNTFTAATGNRYRLTIVTRDPSTGNTQAPSTGHSRYQMGWGATTEYVRGSSTAAGSTVRTGVSGSREYWKCIQAHTAAAANQPGVGANWQQYWVKQYAPTVTTTWTSGTAYTAGNSLDDFAMGAVTAVQLWPCGTVAETSPVYSIAPATDSGLNPLYVANPTGMTYSYDYYFDLYDRTGAAITTGTFTGTRRARGAAGYTNAPPTQTSVTAATLTYDVTKNHWKCTFALPAPGKYELQVPVTSTNNTATVYQVVHYAASKPFTMLGDITPPDPAGWGTNSVSDNSVTLHWTKPTGPNSGDLAGYVVLKDTNSLSNRISLDGGHTFTVGDTGGYGLGTSTVVYVGTNPNTTTCTDGARCSSLQNGVSYNYKVYPYDATLNYQGTGSQTALVPTDNTAMDPVTGVTATVGNMQNTISWTNPSRCDQTGTVIRFKNSTSFPSDPNGNDGSQLAVDLNTTQTSFTHPNLTNGKPYYYSVWAKEDDGKFSALAHPATYAVPHDTVAPGMVNTLSVIPGTTKAFETQVQWTAVGNDDYKPNTTATGYEMRYSNSQITGANWNDAKTVWHTVGEKLPFPTGQGTVQSYKLSGLSPLTSYYIAMRVTDEAGNWSPISIPNATVTTLCKDAVDACNQCHLMPPDDDLPGAHPRGTGNIGAHYLPLHAGGGNPAQCNVCHADGQVWRNNTTLYKYTHQNEVINMSSPGMVGPQWERDNHQGGTFVPSTTIIYKYKNYSSGVGYKQTTGYCANTYCHRSQNSPMWGVESIVCGEYCHETPPATGRHVKHYHPGQYYINFGPAGTKISGYTNDAGTGWEKGSAWTSDTGKSITILSNGLNSNKDARYSTYIKSADAKTTISVPDGTYYVTVCVGDSAAPTGLVNQTVTVSGDGFATPVKLIDNVDTVTGRLYKKTIDKQVIVTGGKNLIVKIGNGIDPTAINFMIINATPEAPKDNNTLLANTADEYGFACGKCHYMVTQEGVTRTTHHVGGPVARGVRDAENVFDANSEPKNPIANYTTVNFGTISSYTDGQGFHYTNGRSCVNTYCHGSTMPGAGGSNHTPTWKDGYIDVNGASICGSCHDTAYKDSTVTSAISTGSHGKHVSRANAYRLDCVKCHYNTVKPRLANYEIQIANKRYHVNGNHDVFFDNQSEFGKYSTVAGNPTCFNVYCHSNGLLDRGDMPYWATQYSTPVWNSGSKPCNYCHGGVRTDGMPEYTNLSTMRNSHVEHVVDNNLGCSKCHYNTTRDNGLTIYSSQPTLHINGTRDVNFDFENHSGVYYKAAQTCSGTYCHSQISAPRWGETLTCGSCHGSADNPTPAYGAHKTHTQGYNTSDGSVVNNSGNISGDPTKYDFSCRFCHYSRTHGGGEYIAGVQTAETNFNAVAPANAYRNASGIYTHGTPKMDKNGWFYSKGSCSNIKCHSNGRGGAPNNTLYNWTTNVFTGCANCHNGDADAPAGRRMKSGKHAMHVFTSVYRRACSDCHSQTAEVGVTAIKDASKHVDGAPEVSMSTTYGGSFDGSKNCNNVYCHSNADPSAWGAGAIYYKSINWNTGSTNCTTCHANNHITGGGLVDGVRTEAQTLSFNHKEHLNPAASSGYGSRIGCTNCHNLTAKTNTSLYTSIKPSNHNNMNKDVYYYTSFFTMSGINTSYYGGVSGSAYWGDWSDPNYGQGSCVVICHSAGKNRPPIRFPNWSTPENTYGCGSCHAADAATWALPAYTTIDSHPIHLAAGKPCNLCHRLTAGDNTGTPFINTSGFTTHHVNGGAANDVKFAIGTPGSYNTGTRTCSGLNTGTCHGDRVWGQHYSSSGCYGCHTSPPRYAQHFAHYSATGFGNLTGVKANDNINGSNATNYKFGCGKCHSNPTHHKGAYVSTNQAAEMAFDSAADPKNTLGKYTTLGALWTTDVSGLPYTAGTCKNLYCHSNGQAGVLAKYSSIKWNTASVSCTSCHGAATSLSLSTQHNKHVNTLANGSYNIGCVQCHNRTVTSNAVISNKAKHVNGVKDVYFATFATPFGNKTGSYNGSVCANTYCHSDGNNTSTKTPTWSGTMTCVSCHNYTKTATPNIMATWAHSAHINNTADANLGTFRCVDCHADTVQSNNTTIFYANGTHVNGVKNVNFVDKSLNNFTGAYLTATLTCRNNYCHSSGQKKFGTGVFANTSTPKFRTTPAWNSGTTFTDCKSCHGADSGFTSQFGEPNYANRSTSGSMAMAWFNGHAKHVKSAADCYTCHNLTVTSAGNVIAAGGYHINGSREVSFSVGGSYNIANKRCTVPTCHSGSMRWGGKVLNSCQSCHSDQGAGAYTFSKHSTTGKHAKHTNSTTYKFACENCHKTMDTSGNTTHGNSVNVKNYQTAEIAFRSTSGTVSAPSWDYITYDGAGTQFRYTRMDAAFGVSASPAYQTWSSTAVKRDPVVSSKVWGPGRCSNLWCHSNAAPLGGANAYVQFANWSTTETTTCTSCHGDKTSGTLSAKHALHVNNGNLASFSCSACHTDTVRGNSTVYSYDYHVNGVKNVNFTSIVLARYTGFYVSGTNTCRNVYCHSSGTKYTSMTNATSSPTFRTPTWGGLALDCKGCHGADSGFTSKYGEPNYANRSTASRAWFNGHYVSNHVSVAADCYKCHMATVNSDGITIPAGSNHLNGFRNVSFAQGGKYDATNKRCSNTATACHSTTVMRWGGSGTCQTCHKASGTEVNDYKYGNHTTATINMNQYTTIGHGKAGKYLYSNQSGASSTNHSATRKITGCESCHDSAVLHNMTSGATPNFFRLKGGGDPNALCATCHALTTTAHHNQTNTQQSTNVATWLFTPKCVDCHDPHGDTGANGRNNAYMIQGLVNYTSASKYDGRPAGTNGSLTKAVSFPANVNQPANLNYTSFARSNYTGLCQICHTRGPAANGTTSPGHYNRAAYEDQTGHSGGNVCTQCHNHNTGFKGSGDCKGCHNSIQGARRNIQTDFNQASHHIVGSWATISATDCVPCHAEGNADGTPNTTYHRQVLNAGDPVDLKVYGTYPTVSRTVAYTTLRNNSSITPVCLGCHNDTNKASTPFSDGRNPNTYAWDYNSIGSKYSNISTTPWGKFNSTTYNVVPADTVNKSFSPHGQTGKNDMPKSLSTFAVYSGTKAVQCYDCHNSHSSPVTGGVSYTSGNTEGGIIKTTATYTPAAGGSSGTKNAYSSSSDLCFDCHLGESGTGAPKTYRDYGIPSGKAVVGYYDRVGMNFNNYSSSRWSTSDVWRGSFAYKDAAFKGGHFGNSKGYLQEGLSTMGTKVNGNCTACHDPHGVSPAVRRSYTKPVRTVYGAGSTEANPVLTGTYSGAANASYVYVVQIVTGGAQSAATYRASTNGGKTWGATSAAGLPAYVSNGITATFQAGNYTADDTWTWQAGANPAYMAPALKGTWMHSPYKEDRAPRNTYTSDKGNGEATARLAGIFKADDYTTYAEQTGWSTAKRFWDDITGGTSAAGANRMVGGPAPRANPDFKTGSYVPGYNTPAIQGDGFGRGPVRSYGAGFTNVTSMRGWNGYFIDENTFGQTTLKGYAQNNPYSNMSTANPAAWNPGNFAGLCLKCHAWQKNTAGSISLSNVTSANLASGTQRVTAKVHETVANLGTITVNLFQRNEGTGTYSSNQPTMGMHMSQYSNNDASEQGGATGQAYAGASYGAVDTTSGTTQFMHYYRWGVYGGTQKTAGQIQAKYHQFPCSKCHTPHTSRLPRLMKTNCLDNDNVGTAHTTMGYVGNASPMSGTTATNLWGALARNVACHSTKIGYAGSSATYTPGGWNKVTPW